VNTPVEVVRGRAVRLASTQSSCSDEADTVHGMDAALEPLSPAAPSPPSSPELEGPEHPVADRRVAGEIHAEKVR
jgi:hypothetical protein